jgi:hypothetical protein
MSASTRIVLRAMRGFLATVVRVPATAEALATPCDVVQVKERYF